MRRYALPVVGILIVTVLCGGYCFLQPLFSDAPPRDWTSEWPTFYKESFSANFWIPAEAEIVSAIQELGPMMGDYQRVVFRLPRTKTPSEWVSEIANASGIGSFRQSNVWYDASHFVDDRPNKHSGTYDSYLIRYLPNDQTYEAIYGWD